MRVDGDGLTFDDVLLLPAYSSVLPRDVELCGQFRLGPVAFGAQYLEAVLHWYFRRPSRVAPMYARLTRITRNEMSASNGMTSARSIVE